MFAEGAGIVVVALEVGDEEIGVLCFLVRLRAQRRPDGSDARVGDGAGGQARRMVGIIRRDDVFRDIVPPAVVGGHPVPEVVVVGVALDVAGRVALQARIGRALGQTVAEHLRHVGVLAVARFLLHKGGQRDQLVQGHALLLELRIHRIGDLRVELSIERCHIVVHGVVLQKLVGLREEIALALHEAVRGVLVLRNVLPEGVRTEIALVGFLQKVLGAAQTGILHFPGNGNRRGALRDGDPHGICLGVLGENGDDSIVGVGPGLQGKITVLQLCRGPLVPHIPAEQVGRADDARVLELLRDGGNAAALPDAHRHLGAGLSVAVDLVVGKHPCCPGGQHQQQYHCQQNLHGTAFFL